MTLGDAGLEVHVVQAPDAATAGETRTAPPALREDTPLKASFLVPSLAQAAAAAAAQGGGTKPVGEAWLWRGQRHLDGHDPEGNVVQFRAAA